eukprot:5828092-Lingulodinium_polyedra.AAC.1
MPATRRAERGKTVAATSLACPLCARAVPTHHARPCPPETAHTAVACRLRGARGRPPSCHEPARGSI